MASEQHGWGLSPEEIQAIVSSVLEPAGALPGVLEQGGDPAVLTAQRLAYQAAAALVAANNRRLTRQLAQAGLVIDGEVRVQRPAGNVVAPPSQGAAPPAPIQD